MIPVNLKPLLEKSDYKFFQLEEIGFSNSDLGLKYSLYEKFGGNYESTFYNIFSQEEFQNELLSQVWIFKNQTPVGLGIAIHHKPPEIVIHEESGAIAQIIGHIHIYVNPAHRGKGLAKEMISPLENMLCEDQNLSHYLPAIIMQDDAYHFGKHLSKTIALPHSIDSDEHLDFNENVDFLYESFKKIALNIPQFLHFEYVKANLDFIENIEHFQNNNQYIDEAYSQNNERYKLKF